MTLCIDSDMFQKHRLKECMEMRKTKHPSPLSPIPSAVVVAVPVAVAIRVKKKAEKYDIVYRQ